MTLDLNSLCPGCFETTHPSPTCPQCGVSVKARRPAGTMPLWTRLDGNRYLIGHVLGQGGFGITYATWDQTLMQRVAIKELFPRTSVARTTDGLTVEPGTDAEVLEFVESKQKFLEEARLLARPSLKQHPGIITVENFFEMYGTAYLVMEYLEGQTLDEYVDSQQGRLPYEVVAAMLEAVLEALKAVHGETMPDGSTMVHRDIKPQNLYITHSGQVKLLDFGAARFAGGQSDRSATAMGTEGYAALEQYQRKTQGPWTDIYATAATWYRLLTGKTPLAAVERLAEDPDPLSSPSSHGADVPPGVESVWLKGLSVLPQDRWATVEDLQTALRTIDQEKVEVAPETPSERPVVEANLKSGSGQTSDEVQGPTSPAKPPVKKGRLGKTLLWTAGSIATVFAAYLIYGYIWDAVYSHMHEIDIEAMAVSYDQSKVVTISYAGMKLWEIPGGEYVNSFDEDIGLLYHVATSPDGRYIATAGTDGIKLWDIESGKIARRLGGDAELDALYKQEPHNGPVRRVAFSPDSATVLTAGDDQTLKLWDLKNGRVVGTYHPEAPATSIAFSPDGHFAVSGSKTGNAQLWNTATYFVIPGKEIRSLVNPTPVNLSVVGSLFTFTSNATKPIKTFEIESSTVVAFAPDGQSTASGGTDGVVVVWDVNTGNATDLFTDHEYDITALAFGPDGVVLASGDAGGYIKVWQLNANDESYTIEPENVLWYQGIVSLAYTDQGLIASNGKTVRVLSTSPEEEARNIFSVVMPEKPF